MWTLRSWSKCYDKGFIGKSHVPSQNWCSKFIMYNKFTILSGKKPHMHPQLLQQLPQQQLIPQLPLSQGKNKWVINLGALTTPHVLHWTQITKKPTTLAEHMTCWFFTHDDLLMTCWDLLMTFWWLFDYLLMTFWWLADDLLMTFWWLADDLPMTWR